MAGFADDAGGRDVVYADNVDFSGSLNPQASVLLNGQLLIGSSVTPNIRVNTLTAGTGVSITNGPGSITIGLTGGGAAIEHITGNTGGQLNPDGSNNFNFLTANSSFIFSGSGSTLTLDFDSLNGSGFPNIFIGKKPLGTLTGGFNTVLGSPNGQFMTLGAANNTGIGANALGQLTTGLTNTGIGLNALSNLITGVGNLGISGPADGGANYLGAESFNIAISNLGVTGESHVIRIGTQGSGSGQQNQCFVAGIRGATTTGATAVGIDSSGKLASPTAITNSLQPCFLAYLSASTAANVTGDGTEFQIPFDTVVFDNTSSFTTGASSVFTAPVTGKYLFTSTSLLLIGVATTNQFYIKLKATSRSVYSWVQYAAAAAVNPGLTVSSIIDMTAGDTLQVTVFGGGGTKTTAVAGSASPYFTSVSGLLFC